MLRTLAVCALLALGLLAFAGGALAQSAVDDPSREQYEGGTAAAEVAAEAEPKANSGLENEIAGLPFTGIDLIVLAGVALVLSGTGFALHRFSAPRV